MEVPIGVDIIGYVFVVVVGTTRFTSFLVSFLFQESPLSREAADPRFERSERPERARRSTDSKRR